MNDSQCYVSTFFYFKFKAMVQYVDQIYAVYIYTKTLCKNWSNCHTIARLCTQGINYSVSQNATQKRRKNCYTGAKMHLVHIFLQSNHNILS